MAIDKEQLAATFQGVLYDVRTKRDGGGRVSIDFGRDSLEAVQFIQTVASKGDLNFQVAMVALPPQRVGEWQPDENGEIEI